MPRGAGIMWGKKKTGEAPPVGEEMEGLTLIS